MLCPTLALSVHAAVSIRTLRTVRALQLAVLVNALDSAACIEPHFQEPRCHTAPCAACCTTHTDTASLRFQTRGVSPFGVTGDP